jgi:hypothetical protein
MALGPPAKVVKPAAAAGIVWLMLLLLVKGGDPLQKGGQTVCQETKHLWLVDGGSFHQRLKTPKLVKTNINQ